MNRRMPLAPAEGWSTLGLVILICLTMAWAMDDAAWVLGREKYLDYLPLAAIGGVLVGFIGPKVGWGRWLTFLIGAIFAALLLPLVVALLVYPAGASIHDLFQATSNAVVKAWTDLAIEGQGSTIQYLHHVLIFGLLVWGTSMFASYATFGHRRPLNGVIAVGIVLVGNMSVTYNNELVFLVIFTVASLFLLIRGHVFDEQSEWVRRRIGDPASISSVYLRGGTVFIGIAVAGSVFLTQTASSKPLAGAWGDFGNNVVSVSRSFARFLPTGGSNRALGLSFGPDAVVQQQWQNNDDVAFTVQRPPRDQGIYYWRAWTYDRIDLTSWGTTPTTTIERRANDPVLKDLADNVPFEGHHQISFTITPDTFRDPWILSPATPASVSEATHLNVVGTGGYFAALQRDQGGPYTVQALTPVRGDGVGELTQEALRGASTVYPDDVKNLYLVRPSPDQMGPDAKALENKILAEAPSKAPFDLASQIEKELKSNTYTYSADLRDVDCVGLSTVECFARFKHGFCQYYAATMAVLLRDMGVPTRIAVGFLPGSVDLLTGAEQVLNSSAHAWVEVYFPGYGWVTFDPTGGNLSQLTPLPSGKPQASRLPVSSPLGTFQIPGLGQINDPEDRPGTGFSSSRLSPAPLIAVAVLLLLIVGGIAFIAWQRGPRGTTNADGAYGTVVRMASRLGFGPRPTQTVYEYAGALGDVLPASRPELQLVANAKVESAYGHVVLGEERLAALNAAQRRLRVSLLRLVLRRRDRPRRRRGIR
jgi:transglutaminase-like putative cysteine protease